LVLELKFGVVFDEIDVYSAGFGPHNWEFPYERRYRKGQKDVLTELERWPAPLLRGAVNKNGTGSR
jgi:hypothetical protein